MVDGETHRGKLVAKEAIDRIDEILSCRDGNSEDSNGGMDRYTIEKAPELLQGGGDADHSGHASDVWSLGATILEFLFDQSVWDVHTLTKNFNVDESHVALKQAVDLRLEPSIISTVRTANPKIHFLNDCINFEASERPTATFVAGRLQQCVLESNGEKKSTFPYIVALT